MSNINKKQPIIILNPSKNSNFFTQKFLNEDIRINNHNSMINESISEKSNKINNSYIPVNLNDNNLDLNLNSLNEVHDEFISNNEDKSNISIEMKEFTNTNNNEKNIDKLIDENESNLSNISSEKINLHREQEFSCSKELCDYSIGYITGIS